MEEKPKCNLTNLDLAELKFSLESISADLKTAAVLGQKLEETVEKISKYDRKRLSELLVQFESLGLESETVKTIGEYLDAIDRLRAFPNITTWDEYAREGLLIDNTVDFIANKIKNQ
jgi:hypothetical protein